MTKHRVPQHRPRCAMVLRAKETAVPAARIYVEVTLETWGLAGLAEDAALVVSELMTNAVRHTSTSVTLTCALSDRNQFVIEVWDSSAALPRLNGAGPLDTHGRGLVIVEALADEWGAHLVDDRGGKVVWAAFDF